MIRTLCMHWFSFVFFFHYASKMLALVSRHIDGVWEMVIDWQDSPR